MIPGSSRFRSGHALAAPRVARGEGIGAGQASWAPDSVRDQLPHDMIEDSYDLVVGLLEAGREGLRRFWGVQGAVARRRWVCASGRQPRPGLRPWIVRRPGPWRIAARAASRDTDPELSRSVVASLRSRRRGRGIGVPTLVARAVRSDRDTSMNGRSTTTGISGVPRGHTAGEASKPDQRQTQAARDHTGCSLTAIGTERATL